MTPSELKAMTRKRLDFPKIANKREKRKRPPTSPKIAPRVAVKNTMGSSNKKTTPERSLAQSFEEERKT